MSKHKSADSKLHASADTKSIRTKHKKLPDNNALAMPQKGTNSGNQYR